MVALVAVSSPSSVPLIDVSLSPSRSASMSCTVRGWWVVLVVMVVVV